MTAAAPLHPAFPLAAVPRPVAAQDGTEWRKFSSRRSLKVRQEFLIKIKSYPIFPVDQAYTQTRIYVFE
jgi:hypothetical protein